MKGASKKSQGGGGFGGMKKGFLFGGPPSNKPKQQSNAVSSSKGDDKEPKKPKPKVKDDLPYLKPGAKTESGLTFNEVQTAMSEAKGLLDNQGRNTIH